MIDVFRLRDSTHGWMVAGVVSGEIRNYGRQGLGVAQTIQKRTRRASDFLGVGKKGENFFCDLYFWKREQQKEK